MEGSRCLMIPIRCCPSGYNLTLQKPATVSGESLVYLPGGELWTVITANVSRHTTADGQVPEPCQHVLAIDTLGGIDRQALTRVLVDQRQHTKRSAVASTIEHEVVTPDVIFVRWAKPHARAISKPQPFAFGLLLWDFQSLLVTERPNRASKRRLKQGH